MYCGYNGYVVNDLEYYKDLRGEKIMLLVIPGA